MDINKKILAEYFHFYNTERPHQTFDGATPLEVYRRSTGGEKKKHSQEERPVHLWTVPTTSDQLKPFGTCGRTMDNKKTLPTALPHS